MSKQIRSSATRRLSGLALAVSLLAPCAYLWPAPAAARMQQPAAAVNSRSASVAAATEEVLRETSEIRKLGVLQPVKSGAQSRAEIERMLVKNLDENSKPEELRATELALKKFGLVPADFRLRPFMISLLTEQVAGYYEPKTKQFYLADWIDLGGQQPVMAHELTHALQDQHYDLRRFEKWPEGDSDAELAAHALVEGDATLVMSFYVMRNLSRAAAMMKSLAAAGQSEQIERAPRVLRESLLFPYQQGMMWASQVYKRGGWPMMSRAYRELPQSTEQILHAEKYFAREAPVKVELADLAAALGKDWRRVEYDVNGEWGYFLVLDEFLKAEGESAKAAAGWGGDRFALYENAQTGATVLAQATAWDTEQDAREFFDAYARRTERRYKGAALDEQAGPADRRVWHTGEGFVVLERQGSRVVVVEGLPDKAAAGGLVKKLMPLS